MNQTDKGPEENGEVCSTTEVQHAVSFLIINIALRLRSECWSLLLVTALLLVDRVQKITVS